MKIHLTIDAEVSEDYVVADIIKALETVLPYMADNVFVRSEATE